MSSAIGERGIEHAFIDVERQSREPGFVGEIGQRQALGDAPARAEPRRVRAARRSRRRSSTLRGRVVRQFNRVQHQRRGLVARIVGAVPEEHARAAAGAAAALAIRSPAVW